MRPTHKFIILAAAGVLSTGCIVRTYEPYPAPPPPPPQEEVVVGGPVFEGPGVEVIEVEPAPVERVYVYDPGYPPGCYFYGGYYWYGGYRYEHDVFIHRYVTVNIRERRYVNVEQNRQYGRQMEARQRSEFAVNHGQPAGRPIRAAARPGPAPRQREHY